MNKFGERLLEAMIPSLECYYHLHVNKKNIEAKLLPPPNQIY
jgi:hypothetical protein